MQQVQMVPGPGPEPKVGAWYAGTDAPAVGSLVCSNTDYTRAAETISQQEFAAVTAASGGQVARERWLRVEKPKAGNIHRFAGVIVSVSADVADGKPGEVKLAWPNGGMTSVLSDAACTIDTTSLYLQSGSFAAGATGSRVIGLAAQTVDRSSTDGLVLAFLDVQGPSATTSMFGSLTRTTVQLPTAAIVDKFPIAAMRADPSMGSLLEVDSNKNGDYPAFTFADTSSTLVPSTALVGELPFLATADNEAMEAQWNVPITVSGAKPWAFGCRLKATSSITTEKGSFEVGLSNFQALVGDLQADTGALPTTGTDYLIFNHDAAATTALDLDYLLSGATHTEHNAAIHTLVLNTYFTVELYFDGTDIATYVNGVVVADPILAADIADGNFPAAQVCVPTIGIKAAHTDDYYITVDWLYAVQQAT